MDAGATIRRARLAAGLSQPELAARSATSQPTLSAYEHGRKAPSIATLERVLAAAGARLTVEAAPRPVLTPSAARLERVARTLTDVLELAAELPARHSQHLRYPRLPSNPGHGA